MFINNQMDAIASEFNRQFVQVFDDTRLKNLPKKVHQYLKRLGSKVWADNSDSIKQLVKRIEYLRGEVESQAVFFRDTEASELAQWLNMWLGTKARELSTVKRFEMLKHTYRKQ